MDNIFYLPSFREELRQVNLQLPSGAGVPIGIKYSVSNLKFALKPDPGFAPAFKSDRKKKSLIYIMRTKEIESYTYYVIMTLNMEKREQRM